MVNIRICPKCKEPKLRNAVNVSGWLAPNMYECSKCGYLGHFFLEIDPEDFELDHEDIEDNTSEN
ncbi:MAG: hypothetical protein ACXAAH_11855 [Promethearchaeota archaeon]|jgi:ribosomal protein L32